MTRYEHTQIGHVIVWFLLVSVLIASGFAGLSHREIPLVIPIIHLTPCGWLYNVSGFDAVAIMLRDGRKFALGTNDPDGLTAEIRNAIRVNSGCVSALGSACVPRAGERVLAIANFSRLCRP